MLPKPFHTEIIINNDFPPTVIFQFKTQKEAYTFLHKIEQQYKND